MKKLNELNLQEAMDGLRKGAFTSIELTEACLSQIDARDDKIKAFITVTRNRALEDATECDQIIKSEGEKAFGTYSLLGVPYSLKDNFCTEGVKTTAASNILKDFIPPYESTVSKKLKAAKAVLIGKTNMDSFAHGSSTESSDFFTTHNPYNLEKLPGGSSGGSAASIASNMCIFSIGSETAGSIRHPASWCGVVGLKPTYGRVSRYGVIAMASSTDSPGPITKTVEDAAFVLEVIAGKDEMDATSSSKEISDYQKVLDLGVRGLKVGVPTSYLDSGLEVDVKERVLKTIELMKEAGASVYEIDLLNPKYAIAVYTILQRSEVSSNLSRFDGIRFGDNRESFNFENKKRIMMGAYTLSEGYYEAYYAKAQKIRTMIVKDFDKAFEKVDVIVGPVTPCKALKIGASRDNAMFGELQDVLVEPSSLAGLPGISVPCGFSDGLPIGFGIVANRFEESKMLQVASFVEMATL
ncbi:MAG: Asp-tRNA(Asn)/Glu-tRNA(Gln) amidotransferase subunit GatA [Patescibacteria group bacterium]